MHVWQVKEVGAATEHDTISNTIGFIHNKVLIDTAIHDPGSCYHSLNLNYGGKSLPTPFASIKLMIS